MVHSASRSARARRVRGIVFVSLVILGAAFGTFVAASVPSSSSADVGHSIGKHAALDASDGVIPDGQAVSVLDEEIPAVGKLAPELRAALRRAATDAEAYGIGVRVNSGWRSPEYQQQLWEDAVVEYGSPEEAGRWVATVDTSAHVPGAAVDIGPFDAAAWVSAHGARYGLCQIYGNEPWHFELRPEAVHDGCPPMYSDSTQHPRRER